MPLERSLWPHAELGSTIKFKEANAWAWFDTNGKLLPEKVLGSCAPSSKIKEWEPKVLDFIYELKAQKKL